MADMDSWSPVGGNARASRKIDRSGDAAQRLHVHHGLLGVPDTSDDRHRDLASLDPQLECKSLLTRLLTFAAPNEAEELAEALLAELPTLGDVVAASAARLATITQHPQAVDIITTARAMWLHALRLETAQECLVPDARAAVAYLRLSMGFGQQEQVRVLFLNAKNHLLRDEIVALGCVNTAPVFPRQILRRALELGSTGLILAHNHPSGDAEPSSDDLDATRQLAAAGRAVGVLVHDHIIIVREGFTSLRQRGLL